MHTVSDWLWLPTAACKEVVVRIHAFRNPDRAHIHLVTGVNPSRLLYVYCDTEDGLNVLHLVLDPKEVEAPSQIGELLRWWPRDWHNSSTEMALLGDVRSEGTRVPLHNIILMPHFDRLDAALHLTQPSPTIDDDVWMLMRRRFHRFVRRQHAELQKLV